MTRLRISGATIIDSLKVIRRIEGVDLGKAKEIIDSSETWADRRDAKASSASTWLQWVSAGPVYLVSIGDFQAEIARFGGQVCGSRGQHYLGRLAQKGDTGSLSFHVPDMAKGDYYFELTVQAGCWRVAASGSGEPLVLHVGDHGIAETAGARSPRTQHKGRSRRSAGEVLTDRDPAFCIGQTADGAAILAPE